MRRLIIVVSVLWVVCFTVFLFRFNRQILDNEEGISDPTQPSVNDISQPVAIAMPASVSGTDLVAQAVFAMNADSRAVLLVENCGNYPIEKAHITIGLGSKLLKFDGANILPGEYLLAKESSGQLYNNEPVIYCYGTQIYDLNLNQ